MSYRDKFPKGPDWKESDGNNHGVTIIDINKKARLQINKLKKELEYTRKMVDVATFYWSSLTVNKDKSFEQTDVLSDKMIIADIKEMTREELEQFADRMRIDRNSFLYRSKEDWEELENKIITLQTDLYFCDRNNQIERIVNENGH